MFFFRRNVSGRRPIPLSGRPILLQGITGKGGARGHFLLRRLRYDTQVALLHAGDVQRLRKPTMPEEYQEKYPISLWHTGVPVLLCFALASYPISLSNLSRFRSALGVLKIDPILSCMGYLIAHKIC